jgi:hypothetical protein
MSDDNAWEDGHVVDDGLTRSYSHYDPDQDDWGFSEYQGTQSWLSTIDLFNRQPLLCDAYAGNSKEGVPVKLPNGELIRDYHSSTGYLMGPAATNGADLLAVAKEGRRLRPLVNGLGRDETGIAAALLIERIRQNVGRGGHFDTQRRRDITAHDGLRQYRQFRDDANVNVGVLMQQAGFSREETLWISGLYANNPFSRSENARPMSPQSHFLELRTEDFIKVGWDIAASGILDRKP